MDGYDYNHMDVRKLLTFTQNPIKKSRDEIDLDHQFHVIQVSKQQKSTTSCGSCPFDLLLSFSTAKSSQNKNPLSINIKTKDWYALDAYLFSKQGHIFIIISSNSFDPIGNIFLSPVKGLKIAPLRHIYVNEIKKFIDWYDLIVDLVLENKLCSKCDSHFLQIESKLYRNNDQEPIISSSEYHIYLKKQYRQSSSPDQLFVYQSEGSIVKYSKTCSGNQFDASLSYQHAVSPENAPADYCENFVENGSNTHLKQLQDSNNDDIYLTINPKQSQDSNIADPKKFEAKNFLSSSPTKEEAKDSKIEDSKLKKSRDEVQSVKNRSQMTAREEILNDLKSSLTKAGPNLIKGMKNSQNICYMNAPLQCLFNTPQFTHYFLKKYHDKERNPKSRGLVSYFFGKMLERIYSCDNNIALQKDYELDIEDIKSNLRIYMSDESENFIRGEQNDAIQFLKRLLELLSEELNRVPEKAPYRQLSTNLEEEDLQAKAEVWHNYFLSRENSIVTDLFGGLLLRLKICSVCKKTKAASFENYWDICLAFKDKSFKEHDLETLISGFLCEERFEDDSSGYPRCCKGDMSLQTQIWALPEILVFTFKRFSFNGDWRKIDDRVRLPLNNFDLKLFIEDSQHKNVQDTKYSLFGIVEHQGSLKNGHYTA